MKKSMTAEFSIPKELRKKLSTMVENIQWSIEQARSQCEDELNSAEMGVEALIDFLDELRTQRKHTKQDKARDTEAKGPTHQSHGD